MHWDQSPGKDIAGIAVDQYIALFSEPLTHTCAHARTHTHTVSNKGFDLFYLRVQSLQARHSRQHRQNETLLCNSLFKLEFNPGEQDYRRDFISDSSRDYLGVCAF